MIEKHQPRSHGYNGLLTLPVNQQLVGWKMDPKIESMYFRWGCHSIVAMLVDQNVQAFSSPPKFNISPLKNDAWKTILSYWGPVTFQGRTVKLREGTNEIPPPKTKMAMDNPPFEDVFPTEHKGYTHLF